MSLTNAQWPTQPIPQAIKDLLTQFYACVDAPQDPNANIVLANEVFSENGIFIINQREINGRDEIVNWRGSAASGNAVAISTHTVEKVYVLDGEAKEILTTGTLYLETKEGKSATSRFAARGKIEDVGGEGLRFVEWQGWVDYMPFAVAGVFKVERLYDTGAS